jgi:PST family polysaccharide transporter
MSSPSTETTPDDHIEETMIEAATGSSPSLDKSLVMGIAWTGGMKWATQIFSWAATIIIARLLTPADYGVMGMAMVYIGLVALVNEFGLTAAILTRRDLTPDQIAQIGGFGLGVGVAFTFASMALAAPIAWFYSDPAVREVIMWLSLNFTITAAGILPRALMSRDLQFHRLAWIDGASNLTQMGMTLILAVFGFRYFSLVFGSLAGSTVGMLLAIRWNGHRIAWPRPFRSIKESVHVGWHVVVGRVAWYTYQNADFAIVGRVLGKVVLGAYTLGWEVATVPVERVSALVGQVTPSIFSTVQHDRVALRRYYLAIVGGLAIITFPAAVGIALTANLLVPVLLGDHWTAAIVPLQVLAAYAGIRSIDTVAPQVLVYSGHSRQSMWFSVLAACVLPVAFLIGTRWGAGGVAAAWVAAYPIVVIPSYRLLFRILNMSLRMYIANIWPAISGSLVMALVILVVRPTLRTAMLPRYALVAEILIGAATYAAVMLLAHRDRLVAFRNLIRTARS